MATRLVAPVKGQIFRTQLLWGILKCEQIGKSKRCRCESTSIGRRERRGVVVQGHKCLHAKLERLVRNKKNTYMSWFGFLGRGWDYSVGIGVLDWEILSTRKFQNGIKESSFWLRKYSNFSGENFTPKWNNVFFVGIRSAVSSYKINATTADDRRWENCVGWSSLSSQW